MGAKTDCPACPREVKRVINYGTGGALTLNLSDAETVCICPHYDRAVIHDESS